MITIVYKNKLFNSLKDLKLRVLTCKREVLAKAICQHFPVVGLSSSFFMYESGFWDWT
jgi:hypothetical protein